MYSLGLQAFARILELMDKATRIGHDARRRYKTKHILEYFCILETLYIPISPAIKEADKIKIENELNSIRKTNINISKKEIIGNKEDIVKRLTNLENIFYNSMQVIDMYIKTKRESATHSKRNELLEHLEGSDFDLLEDDENDDI